MLKRTLVFSSPMVLSLKNQQLVLAYKDSPDERQTVPIEDLGVAARIYFQHLFGDSFIRNRDEPGINALLNYGYSILRAATCRAIVSSGLLPAIGMFHHNRSNAYPLADDLMEPFRPFVDGVVYDLAMRGEMELTKEVKGELISVLYADTLFDKTKRPLSVGLSMTTASMAKCLSKELNTLSLPAFP